MAIVEKEEPTVLDVIMQQMLRQLKDICLLFRSHTVVIQQCNCSLEQVICKSLQFSFWKIIPHNTSDRCDSVEDLLSGICHSLLIGR